MPLHRAPGDETTVEDPEREVRWERMFPDQLEAEFARRQVVYFGYGLCEPHGPHAVLGLDALKAHGILVRCAQRFGGIVAPVDAWHVHEMGGYALWAEREIGEARPWLTAVPPWIHFKNLCYHLRAAEVLDFRVAILLTGHYGPNYQDLRTLVARIQPRLRMRVFGLPDFEANRPGFPGDGMDGDHAGKVETSLLWALEPEGVDLSRLPDEPTYPLFAAGRDAAVADRSAGERMVDDITSWLGQKSDVLLAQWRPDRPSRLRTFDDVERFWAEEMAPDLERLASMQSSWYEREAPDPASRWAANWPVTRPR